MSHHDTSHPSDKTLLLSIDGELSPDVLAIARKHAWPRNYYT